MKTVYRFANNMAGKSAMTEIQKIVATIDNDVKAGERLIIVRMKPLDDGVVVGLQHLGIKVDNGGFNGGLFRYICTK